MNEKKIAFITCVKNNELYQRALKFIRRLYVPKGYLIELINVNNPTSLTSGYNIGMQLTDAKYKIYFHQDAFILHKKFIMDIINIFNKNEKIGIIGVIGAKSIPISGIWWESYEKTGKVYDSHTGKMELLDFQKTDEKYEIVRAIDGLIIVTQYDLLWREDIFDGWHFYDLSQCLEFTKHGYEIVIPYQRLPWCIHDCGIVNLEGYENYRKIFLEEYKSYL